MGTARGFGAALVVRVGFFVGFGDAVRLGAAPIEATELGDGVGSTMASSTGASVGASVTDTGAAWPCGLSPGRHSRPPCPPTGARRAPRRPPDRSVHACRSSPV
ncbi:hypothetical protein GCM10027614_24440 [Micromonospora vulcania]